MLKQDAYSQNKIKSIIYEELYAHSLGIYINAMKKNRDSLLSTKDERNIRLSKYYDILLEDRLYILNEGNLNSLSMENFPLNFTLLNKFELSKLLNSKTDIEHVLRIGNMQLNKGCFVIPVGIFSPSLDRETHLIMFGGNGNTLVNYIYNCEDKVFDFLSFGKSKK